MIGRMLPAGVTFAEAFRDLADAPLFEPERAVVASAVTKRRREFGTVRACARDALAQLGIPACPILPGSGRAPRWPAGVVGSMTHCEGYRAAAVARRSEFMGLGIDAEPDVPLRSDVRELVASREEASHLAALEREQPGLRWDLLLFSAKESVFKAWFPAAATWLDFDDVRVTFHPSQKTFSAELRTGERPPGWTRRIAGRWLVEDGLVLTSVAVARAGG